MAKVGPLSFGLPFYSKTRSAFLGPPLQPLRRVVIRRFQPVKRAPIARVLHDDGNLAQFFESSLRREQLKFEFSLFTGAHRNGGAGNRSRLAAARPTISPSGWSMNVP